MLTLSLIAIAIASFSQLSSDEYLTKSHHQKTVAWIMLGGGVGLTALGVAVSQANTVDYALGNSSNHNTAGTILAVSGVASTLGSIPMFISAGHNKRKAAELSLALQNTPMLYTTGYRMAIRQPAIRLTIPL